MTSTTILSGLGLQTGHLLKNIFFSTDAYITHTLKQNLLFHSSAMFSILLQVVIVSAILHVLWKRLFIKSALDNIPGPPSRSFLFGNFTVFTPWVRLLIVYHISRCFSTGFQQQGMGISQRHCPEMYEYLSIFLRRRCWRLVDGSVIKIKAFLGVCAVSVTIVQIDPDGSLI